MRTSIIAKAATATAALLAATGGLAVAHALPAPVQDAVSHIGIGSPANSGGSGTPSVDDTSTKGDPTSTTIAADTTVPGDTTPTTAAAVDTQGDGTTDGSHDEVTTTTVADGTTPTSMHVDLGDNNQSEVDNSQSDNNQNETGNNHSGRGQDNSGIQGHDSTSPATVDPTTTPTTEVSGGGSNHGNHRGGSDSSGSNQGSGSGSGADGNN